MVSHILNIRIRHNECAMPNILEVVMSEYMLHIFAPTRFDNVGAIVGDHAALRRLRDAINDAMSSGTGGTYLRQSDGEGYSLAVLEAADMTRVCPTFPVEAPTRNNTRQMVGMRALPRFLEAIQKSRRPVPTALAIPHFTPQRQARS